MALDSAATRTWARENKAAFEIAPLFEPEKGERVCVGFELELYARTPTGLASPEPVVTALWDRLREIAESLVPLIGADARVEAEAFDMADRLRPETQFAPEVLFQARLVHDADCPAAVAEDVDSRLRPLEQRLRELGLRARSW